MHRHRARWAAVLLLLGAACSGSRGDRAATVVTVRAGSQAPGSSVPGPVIVSPATTAPASTTAPATVNIPGAVGTTLPTTTLPAAHFEFVDYTRSGGLAGGTDRLKVFPDGRAVYDDGARTVNFTVAASTVTDLRASLDQAAAASLPANDTGRTPFPDAFTYNLIFGGRAVRFHDGTVPAPLAPALTVLNREMARGKAMR